jgi:hypothetical protein
MKKQYTVVIEIEGDNLPEAGNVLNLINSMPGTPKLFEWALQNNWHVRFELQRGSVMDRIITEIATREVAATEDQRAGQAQASDP